MYRSRDGENGETATDSPAFQNLTYFDAAVFDGKLMIFGGVIEYTTQNDVCSWSPDMRQGPERQNPTHDKIIVRGRPR